MAEEMRALYLIAGTDGAKIDATRARLRARAEREGGADALEVFEPGEGRGMPDHEALLAAIPAMSLMDSRRYLLADGVERWRDRQLEAVAAALGDLPPDLTLVLIARAKAPAKLAKAVKAAEGRDPRVRGAESARDAAASWSPTPSGSASGSSPPPPASWSTAWAPTRCGCSTSSSGWRCGPGRGARSSAADLEAMIADTSEAAVWSLSDALLERDAAARPADRRAADRPGRERHRPDLRPRLAPARRLRRRRPARGGGPAEAGRVVAEDAPLRGQAAGRPPARRRPRRPARWRPRRSPTSSSGAAAAPTTATSWR